MTRRRYSLVYVFIAYVMFIVTCKTYVDIDINAISLCRNSYADTSSEKRITQIQIHDFEVFLVSKTTGFTHLFSRVIRHNGDLKTPQYALCFNIYHRNLVTFYKGFDNIQIGNVDGHKLVINYIHKKDGKK